MKLKFILLQASFYLVFASVYGQNVGIGTVTPAAKLDVISTTSGVLIPRLALTSASSASPVTSPVASMLIYNTATAGSGSNAVTPGFYYWTGSTWDRVVDQQFLSTLPVGGDATGTLSSLTVVGLQGQPVSGTAPAAAQLLQWNGSAWTPTTVSGDATISSTGVVTIGSSSGNYIKNQISQQPSSNYNISGNGIIGGNLSVGTSANDRFDVLASGGKDVLIGGGANTGAEVKLTSSGSQHFSLYNSGNSKLTIAQTSSVLNTNNTGTALMTFDALGNINIPALTASAGVYTDASKNLTNTAPSSGQLGYWTRTGSSLYNTNTGDNVGIGMTTPGFPLNFASSLGDKISLYGSSGAHYGFGIQNTLLQIFADASTSDVAVGYGSSGSFTEVARFKGNGGVGIGTSSIPKNAVGYAKLAIDGPVTSGTGPHIQYTTTSDNYPLYQQLNWTHDNIAMTFDGYYDGAWKSATTTGGSFQIYKQSGLLNFNYSNVSTQGTAAAYSTGISMNNTGRIGIGVNVSPTTTDRIYLYRAGTDIGPNTSGLQVYRTGQSGATNGGTDFTNTGVDAGVKGYSYWGNNFSAGVYGGNYGDYASSGGVVGYMNYGGYYGALGFRDANSALYAVYAGGPMKVSNAYFYSDYNCAGTTPAVQSNAGALAIGGNYSTGSGGSAEVDFWNASPAVGTSRGFWFWGETSAGSWTTVCKMNQNGSLNAASYSNFSDQRLKKDIRSLTDIEAQKIYDISGYEYKWNKEKMTSEKLSSDDYTHYGVLAQELEKIFPNIVYTDEAGIKSVNYSELLPLVITAMKDQNKRINELTEKINLIEKK